MDLAFIGFGAVAGVTIPPALSALAQKAATADPVVPVVLPASVLPNPADDAFVASRQAQRSEASAAILKAGGHPGS